MFDRISKLKLKYIIRAFILVVILLFSNNKVNAASLFLSPISTTVSVGNIVSLKIIANTNNKSINNAEASIQFPVDMLEVVSITKNSSIFTLWVEEPSFSNNLGKINFNGGLPNPGYIGQNGYIATITFKAKKPGLASILFVDGAVRENDGLGTDVLISKNGANINIGTPEIIEVPNVPTNQNPIPVRPIIISETHPNQDVWYKNNIVSFSWKIPNGVTSLKTLFNRTSDSVPTITYDNSVTQKTLNDVSDGVSYFHLRYFNANGGSLISHYRVKVDSTPPLAFTPSVRVYNNRNLIKLNAIDATSGLDYYTIKIDDNQLIKVKKEDLINEEYYLPVQSEGNHNLVVFAYDKAGNYKESNLIFTSSTISIPIISLSSEEITKGEIINISGKTDYPNEEINVILESNGNEIARYTQAISNDGTFLVVTNKIKTTGLITVWAETVFDDLIKSAPSQKAYLNVNEDVATKITLAIVTPLIYLIIILIIILIIFMILYLGWHKYFGLKRKIKSEANKLIFDIHDAMVLLKEELDDQLKVLEKTMQERNLNKKEEEIFNEIKKNINDIDNLIKKKLNKII